jgi:GNAT superfamily N-acetyltransferase
MGTQEVQQETTRPDVGMSAYTITVATARMLSPQYKPLIYSKWLRSLRFGNDYFLRILQDAYYKSYHRYITSILDSKDALVCLAVLSDDRDVVLGFSVSRGNILDYVHVHKDYRGNGIAKALVPRCIDTFTHITKLAQRILDEKYKDWKFNPFA